MFRKGGRREAGEQPSHPITRGRQALDHMISQKQSSSRGRPFLEFHNLAPGFAGWIDCDQHTLPPRAGKRTVENMDLSPGVRGKYERPVHPDGRGLGFEVLRDGMIFTAVDDSVPAVEINGAENRRHGLPFRTTPVDQVLALLDGPSRESRYPGTDRQETPACKFSRPIETHGPTGEHRHHSPTKQRRDLAIRLGPRQRTSEQRGDLGGLGQADIADGRF